MVAVVSGPAKRHFRKVARANHQAVELVGHIHENLRAFAGLCIFVGHIMAGRVVVDVGKMPHHSLRNVDFTNGDAQSFHQFEGIGVGAVGGAKSRHSDADDAVSVQPQAVESVDRDEQRQGRVQPAADAQNRCFGLCMHQAGRQSLTLYAEDFLAASVQFFALRNERKWVYDASEGGGMKYAGRFYLYNRIGNISTVDGNTVCKRRVLSAFTADAVDVDFGHSELRL